MSSDSWSILSHQWGAALKSAGISAYRSSDCNSSKGEYAGWDGPKKDALREQLIEVINGSWRGKHMPICPVFTWTILDRDIFKSVSGEFPLIQISDYEYSIIKIVAGSRCAIRETKGDNTLGLFFEDGQDVRPHVRKVLKEIVRPETRIVDISFLTKADHIPLQVADMIAYEAWKSQSEGTRKVLIDLIKSGVGEGLIIDEDNIRRDFTSWCS